MAGDAGSWDLSYPSYLSHLSYDMTLVFPSRLYAILDVDAARARGLAPDDVLDAWLSAGVRLVQLRAKSLETGPFLELAERCAEHAGAAGAIFVVNDRVDVAALSGAAGVHVGQTDLSAADARALLGADRLVGLSTHSAAQSAAAGAAPIDYLAVGPVFPTTSKSAPDPVVGLALVGEAAAASPVPVVAIGGITLATAPAVLAAGAGAAAVVADLLAGDPGARARAYLAVLA